MNIDELLEALELLKNYENKIGNNEILLNISEMDFIQIINDAIKIIKEKPSKENYAKWVKPDEGYDPTLYRKCSVCGRHIKAYERGIDHAGNSFLFKNIATEYCPKCGKRMRDGE